MNNTKILNLLHGEEKALEDMSKRINKIKELILSEDCMWKYPIKKEKHKHFKELNQIPKDDVLLIKASIESIRYSEDGIEDIEDVVLSVTRIIEIVNRCKNEMPNDVTVEDIINYAIVSYQDILEKESEDRRVNL